jgi:hypothetical protein
VAMAIDRADLRLNYSRRGFLGAVAAAPLTQVCRAQLRSPGEAIVCRVIDADSGRPVPARVRLVDEHSNEVVPVGHVPALAEDAQEGDVRFQGRRYSYVNGEFRIDPRHLPLQYQILKGYEYEIAGGELTAASMRGNSFTIPLSRWSASANHSWYSGDIHIHHISPKTCRLEMDAEDLNVANILTSDFTRDQKEFEGKLNAYSSGKSLIYVNQEFRSDHFGHMCLLNLKQLIEPVATQQPFAYPLHAQVCDRVHAQGGYVSWAHFPSMPALESPLDVALEKLDGLELLCVLEPRELPVFVRKEVPEMGANSGLRMWYRYLNCGFRLAATAGTDKMTTFVTVGANRVYAHVQGEFNYQNWVDALKHGRTFVSNNPILTFTVNGQEPGAHLALASKKNRALEIFAHAESQLPYDKLEIVCNGETISSASPSGPHHTAEIHLEYPLRGSCWIAARAMEDLGRYPGVNFSAIHRGEGTLFSSLYGTRRPENVFAHTSPVYATVDGKPIRSWDDARYYVGYIGHAIDWLRTEARFASAEDRKSSVAAFEQARAVYEQRAREARQTARQ